MGTSWHVFVFGLLLSCDRDPPASRAELLGLKDLSARASKAIHYTVPVRSTYPNLAAYLRVIRMDAAVPASASVVAP